MFKTIIEIISQNSNLSQGIYLENKKNYWLTIMPKSEKMVIQWKNGGFKKRQVMVKNIEDSNEIFKEWEEEIEKSKEANNLVRIFNEDIEYFKDRLILGQRGFKKNIRTFEISLIEKLKNSNESFNIEENSLSYITIYSFIKQFHLKIDLETFSLANPLKQRVIFFKKDKETKIIRKPLEFKLVLENALSKEEKYLLKENFSKKAKRYLFYRIDPVYTGIERLFEKFKI